MKKSTGSKKRKTAKTTSFGRIDALFWLKNHIGIVVAAGLSIVLIAVFIICIVNSNAARTRNQLVNATTPTPTEAAEMEVVVLPGVSDVAIAEAEVTPTEEPKPTEEVAEATEEAADEEADEEEAEEAEPTENAKPTQGAQPTQQAQQSTQQTAQPTQPVQPTQQPTQVAQQPTGGSWSYSYHNDNGVVTISTSGAFPAGVDPNDPASVQRWIESQTGLDYSTFFR